MLQQTTDSSGTRFTPLVVVELASDTKEEAVAWLLSRIRAKQQNGGVEYSTRFSCLFNVYAVIFSVGCPGAELLVEQLSLAPGGQEKENPNVFLVGATRQRLLFGAEEVGLFKEYSDGSMRAFTCASKDNFTDFKGKLRTTRYKSCLKKGFLLHTLTFTY